MEKWNFVFLHIFNTLVLYVFCERVMIQTHDLWLGKEDEMIFTTRLLNNFLKFCVPCTDFLVVTEL